MKGEIVSVGTEMLLGMIVDTNSQYLTQQLADIGVDVFWISQVGDNLGRVVEIIQRGLDRSDVIVMTGGLGPTEDDLTRESIAAALGEQMAIMPELELWLRDLFARRNRPMPERNLKQATLIPSARALSNAIGTAPGWLVEHQDKLIVAMPGVPSEMRLMWEQQAKPVIQQRSGSSTLVTVILKVLGLGEGAVEEALGELVHGTNPTVATYAKPDGVHVRVSAKAPSEAEGRRLIEPVAEDATRRLTPWVYGRDEDTLGTLAARVLVERDWHLAAVERGTGGSLYAEISEDAGLLARFQGGFLVANDGTPLGVGRPSPSDLATAARIQTGAEAAVATVLAMDNGMPVAEYAVDVQNHVETGTSRWNLAIPELRRRAAVESMALLVRVLRDAD